MATVSLPNEVRGDPIRRTLRNLRADRSQTDYPLRMPQTTLNQPPPFEDVNLFTADRPLVEALRREGAAWAEERVRAFGEIAGRRETIAWGSQANGHPPALRTHDRRGERIDEVEFDPAWHSLMRLGVEHGLHALPWR